MDDIMSAVNLAFARANNQRADGRPSPTIRQAVYDAIAAERKRCISICEAEREWGGNIEDAQKRIESGATARPIQGWNVPYEDEAQ